MTNKSKIKKINIILEQDNPLKDEPPIQPRSPEQPSPITFDDEDFEDATEVGKEDDEEKIPSAKPSPQDEKPETPDEEPLTLKEVADYVDEAAENLIQLLSKSSSSQGNPGKEQKFEIKDCLDEPLTSLFGLIAGSGTGISGRVVGYSVRGIANTILKNRGLKLIPSGEFGGEAFSTTKKLLGFASRNKILSFLTALVVSVGGLIAYSKSQKEPEEGDAAAKDIKSLGDMISYFKKGEWSEGAKAADGVTACFWVAFLVGTLTTTSAFGGTKAITDFGDVGKFLRLLKLTRNMKPRIIDDILKKDGGVRQRLLKIFQNAGDKNITRKTYVELLENINNSAQTVIKYGRENGVYKFILDKNSFDEAVSATKAGLREMDKDIVNNLLNTQKKLGKSPREMDEMLKNFDDYGPKTRTLLTTYKTNKEQLSKIRETLADFETKMKFFMDDVLDDINKKFARKLIDENLALARRANFSFIEDMDKLVKVFVRGTSATLPEVKMFFKTFEKSVARIGEKAKKAAASKKEIFELYGKSGPDARVDISNCLKELDKIKQPGSTDVATIRKIINKKSELKKLSDAEKNDLAKKISSLQKDKIDLINEVDELEVLYEISSQAPTTQLAKDGKNLTIREIYKKAHTGRTKTFGKTGDSRLDVLRSRVKNLYEVIGEKNIGRAAWILPNLIGSIAVYNHLDDIEETIELKVKELDSEPDTTDTTVPDSDIIDLDPSEIRPNLEETSRTRNNILVIGDSTALGLLQNYSGKWQGYESDFAGKLEQYSITPQHSSKHGKAFGEKIQDHPVGRTKPEYGSNGLPGFSKHVVLGAGNTDQIYKFLEYKVNNKKEKFIVPKTAIIHMGYNDIGKTYDRGAVVNAFTNFQKTINLLKTKGVKDIRVIGPRVGNDKNKSPRAAQSLYLILRQFVSQDPQVTFVHNELRNRGKTNPYPHMGDGVHYKLKSNTDLFNDALKGFNWERGQPLPSTLHPTGYFTDAPGANKRVKNYNVWELVQKEAKKNSEHMNPLLKMAQLFAESKFIRGAVSTKKAVGIAQIMPKTATKSLGMTVNETQDDRLSVPKSIIGSFKHDRITLKAIKAQFRRNKNLNYEDLTQREKDKVLLYSYHGGAGLFARAITQSKTTEELFRRTAAHYRRKKAVDYAEAILYQAGSYGYKHGYPTRLPDARLKPKPKKQEKQEEVKQMSKKDISILVSEMLNENSGQGYSNYPYGNVHNEKEATEDYVKEWKALSVELIRDESRTTAIEIAKILIKDLELFEDVLDLAGQNQSVGTEILEKLKKVKSKEIA